MRFRSGVLGGMLVLVPAPHWTEQDRPCSSSLCTFPTCVPVVPSPPARGGAYLTIEEAVEDGHDKALGTQEKQRGEADSPQQPSAPSHPYPRPCVLLVKELARCKVGS